MAEREKVIQGLLCHEERSVCVKDGVLCPYFNDKDCYRTLNADALELLRTIEPTVDAKPVKHGYWKPGFLAWVCSNCRYDVSIDKPQYCPDCGAKMDGERREENDQA